MNFEPINRRNEPMWQLLMLLIKRLILELLTLNLKKMNGSGVKYCCVVL